MAIEKRGNRKYYYRSTRENGRVVKEYCGCASSEVFSTEDADEERAQAKQYRSESLLFESSIKTFSDEALQLSRLFLMAEGYHRHHRGEWRKRKMNTDIAPTYSTAFHDGIAKENTFRDASALIPDTDEERMRVVRLGMTRDDDSVALAVAILRQYPDTVTTSYLKETRSAIWRVTDNEVGRQLFTNEAERMREGFRAGRTPDAVPYAERLLIERVVANRFAVVQAEGAFFDGMPLRMAEFAQRRLDFAHKRYLSAIETLARVQRLALPTVNVAMPGATQINVGEKQVNLQAV